MSLARCVLCALLSALLLPAVADAARVSRTDRDADMRFTLDGRELTVAPAPVRGGGWFSGGGRERPRDRRERAVCGDSFRRPLERAGVVMATAHWPAGARAATFRFRRDISARVRWCLIEPASGPHRGGDEAFISVVSAGPRRDLAAGRGPDGRPWRLVVWRGDRLEPCARLTAGNAVGMCFDDQAERVARLDVDLWLPDHCGDDTFVFGVAPPTTARVELTLGDGARADARLLPSPPVTRLRASWFVIALADAVVLRGVEAFDATGRSIGRERYGHEGVLLSGCEQPPRSAATAG